MKEPIKIKGCLHSKGFDLWSSSKIDEKELVIEFIEHSAYQALERKLEVAEQWLERIQNEYQDADNRREMARQARDEIKGE